MYDPGMYGIVYVATNSVTAKQYVGITTCKLAHRWRQHVKASERGSKLPLHLALAKYGEAAFALKVAASCENQNDLHATEIRLIAELGTFGRRGYNCTLGGEGLLGLKRSAETREKIGAAQRGRTLPRAQVELMMKSRIGFRQTEAAKRAISRPVIANGVEYLTITQAAEALKVSATTICRRIQRGVQGYAELVERRTRRKRTPEQCAKMRERTSVPVLAEGIRFASITEASIAIGLTRPGIAYRIKIGSPGYAILDGQLDAESFSEARAA